MRLKIVVSIACFSFVLFSFGSMAQNLIDQLLGGVSGNQNTTIYDPAGYFSATIPGSYFSCNPQAKDVECVGRLPVKANLSIKVTDVPLTATANLVALNLLGQYEKQSYFKLIQSSQTVIDQVPAVVQTFTYLELDNIQLSVWMKTLSAVVSGKLIAVQVQCRSLSCQEYAAAISTVFSTLKIAPVDKAGNPIKGKIAAPKGNSLDAVIQSLES
ncbi:MAG: hypothetical protein O2897_01985 [bacterium]|nr:hypothetical protein [bacterium]